MSGAMLSEASCALVIMMVSLDIIDVPYWLPECYRDKRHCFQTGYARIRYCTPALVIEMGSDPKHYLATKSRNNIPAHLWTFPKAKPRLEMI